MSGWGFGKEEVAKGRKTLSDLQTAETAQEKAVKDLPPKTRELCALKGRTFLMLKQLSRAARRVFVHDPATAAKFGVDILNRRGHKHSAAEAAPVGAGEGKG